MTEKEYLISSIRKKEFSNGGSVLNCSFKLDDLEKYANDGGWINLTIAERREVSDKGATHYAYNNDYEPKKQEDKTYAETPSPKQTPPVDDLPF
jgi:hypothetical protein